MRRRGVEGLSDNGGSDQQDMIPEEEQRRILESHLSRIRVQQDVLTRGELLLQSVLTAFFITIIYGFFLYFVNETLLFQKTRWFVIQDSAFVSYLT